MFGLGLILLLQVQSATIEGVVSKPGGIDPLPGARIFLTPSGPNSSLPFNPFAPLESAEALGRALGGEGAPDGLSSFSTTSEDDGRFSLRDIPAGDYTLSVQTTRYGSVVYGQRRSGGPGSTLTINSGQKLTDIKIAMAPTGAIAGRITGHSGEPVVRALVQAYQSSYRDGKRTLVSRQTAVANDLGEYRLFSLPAGQYFVAATEDDNRIYSRSGGEMISVKGETLHIQRMAIFEEAFGSGTVINRVLEDGTIQEEAWMPMYYPGTTLGTQATPIDVAAGATMNGINIGISPSPVRKISGQVLGPPGSAPEVTIIPPNSYLGFKTLSVDLEPRRGSFEFKGIVPGLYTLIARDKITGVASAPVQIEVGDRDVDNLTIGLTPGTPLTGRIVFEDSLGEADADLLSSIAIELKQRHLDLPRKAAIAEPGAGGRFALNNVSAGEYQAEVRDPLQYVKPVFVKSVRLGLADVTDGIVVTPGTRDSLEIVLTRDTGSVEGVVMDSRRTPAVGATVVLVPAVTRRNSSRYASVVSDRAGQFRLQGIVPGEYLLFAWDDVETGAWQNAEFLKLYESRGRPVKVSGTDKQEVQITVISNP